MHGLVNKNGFFLGGIVAGTAYDCNGYFGKMRHTCCLLESRAKSSKVSRPASRRITTAFRLTLLRIFP